jgi:hypothetical protein
MSRPKVGKPEVQGTVLGCYVKQGPFDCDDGTLNHKKVHIPKGWYALLFNGEDGSPVLGLGIIFLYKEKAEEQAKQLNREISGELGL